MDANRRPQLPALHYLHDDKVKREEEAAYQQRITGTAQSLSTTIAGASPTYHYPPGPPPPYSHSHAAPSTIAWSGAPTSAVHTPPESRRTSEHDKDMAKPRQSLPSISEALGGVDNQSPFAPAVAPPPALHAAHLPQPPTSAPTSPPPPRRSYPMEPPQTTSAPYSSSNSYSQYSSYRPEHHRQSSYPPPESTRPAPAAYPPVLESKPTQPQTTQPQSRLAPQPTSFARAPESSPKYEQSTSQPAVSMAPPPPSSAFTYGYTQYPPRYADPAPAASTASGPIYQPSAHFGAPQGPPSGSRYDEGHSTMASHDNNVKRHLDFFDLEAALTEISSTSGILSDFSRRYGDRMHGTQRAGVTPQSLPGVVEIDDMINKSRVAHESLMKIRDVVLQQQLVYQQQAADQRQQHKGFEQHHLPQPAHHLQEVDDTKGGGFAGVDTKKRRGRAAPPGRCHSCNRAETPEWRRGPDGARTLCNACGLHYAKLTRKNNGANKNTNVGNSNLQPKQN